MVTFDRLRSGKLTMALESVAAAENPLPSIQNNEDDLEDGEIPSDEDDEPMPMPVPAKLPPELSKTPLPRSKNSDSKYSNKNNSNRRSSSQNRDRPSNKYKGDDWAGEVQMSIKAALEEDKSKSQDNKSKPQDNKPKNNCKSNKSKSRKRFWEMKEDDRHSKDHKRKKASDEENAGNEDDDEMLFVRGASPVKKNFHDNNSPPRKISDRDNDSGSDVDDRSSSRHKDNDRKGNNLRGNYRNKRKRGGKGDRGTVKNKNRNQARNERNNSRRNNNTQNTAEQDPDAICVYYMQGKCHRGEDCPFSHNALPPRKMELCKFYLMDCCAKRDKCLYMHHDFPCKFFHTGMTCSNGDNCKFSHNAMNEQLKNILLKHLETAPKEILGNFPRMSRDNAATMIDETEQRIIAGIQLPPGQFPAPNNNFANFNKCEEKDGDCMNNNPGDDVQQKVGKERKNSGKKTRWGSDEDRVPYEQIMMLQSANTCGLQVPNATQQQLPPISMDFYNEIKLDPVDDNENVKQETKQMEEKKEALKENKFLDLDFRQLLPQDPKRPQVVSMADEIASLTKMKGEEEVTKEEEEVDDEELDLIINEMPMEDEEAEVKEENDTTGEPTVKASSSPHLAPPEHLPKETQELFMRIQQQQRGAQDSFRNLDEKEVEEALGEQNFWYSDDEDEDEDSGNLTIVLNNSLKEESDTESVKQTNDEPSVPEIPQPAAIVDKLGDLSKIDISAEVSQLLMNIRSQSAKNNQTKKEEPKVKPEPAPSSFHVPKPEAYYRVPEDQNKQNVEDTMTQSILQALNIENGSAESTSSENLPSASRDPRMSRDPRDPRQQRMREEPKVVKADPKDCNRYQRLETSIYSSGLMSMDNTISTDRTRIDPDHRAKDLDLRQCFPPSFGDTDLRVTSDIDFRQILSLPFKPAPTHVPCKEIEAGVTSHPPMVYKVQVVDIPRPDYSGLKISRNDRQVKYDPRLRMMFGLGRGDTTVDSPMSPPMIGQQFKVSDTPKSPPPQVRADPRRKAPEIPTIPINQMPPLPMQCNMHPPGTEMGHPMGMGPQFMPGPPQNMQPMMPNQGIGPMMMGGPPNMMGPPGMGGPMGPPPPGVMGGPMGPPMMNFDPRFNPRGPGLLGPCPPMGFNPEHTQGYDASGPNFGSNFGNFDPNMRPHHPPFGNNAPDGTSNFQNNRPEWNGPPVNRRGGGGGGGRARRRNRAKNTPIGNRSPP